MSDEPQRPASAGTTPSTARRAGAALGRAAGSAFVGGREAIRRNPKADKVYRTGVGVVGGTTVALGVVMMPLPGPGALIALGGLGILGSEFEGAQKVNRRATKVVRKAAGAAKKAVDRRRQARAAREAPATD
ncbi:PGPGW domain-containing protein [Schumannella sp. 10F1B-5-1]|uniref:PGPGW domain-containing protein n=1 Tax=Schumannella sp. 10F1B-5-1 TaxID=2590780 RepID=UPI0011313652|nr:PGPGW domain-containing protein [Schumannella sp. 10F1B-5-1]TPW76935.1 hypothetical protein FJ658_03155 [Schumannella sp. 10F1B-5-1]